MTLGVALLVAGVLISACTVAENGRQAADQPSAQTEPDDTPAPQSRRQPSEGRPAEDPEGHPDYLGPRIYLTKAMMSAFLMEGELHLSVRSASESASDVYLVAVDRVKAGQALRDAKGTLTTDRLPARFLASLGFKDSLASVRQEAPDLLPGEALAVATAFDPERRNVIVARGPDGATLAIVEFAIDPL